jgi:hypothetical protein
MAYWSSAGGSSAATATTIRAASNKRIFMIEFP